VKTITTRNCSLLLLTLTVTLTACGGGSGGSSDDVVNDDAEATPTIGAPVAEVPVTEEPDRRAGSRSACD